MISGNYKTPWRILYGLLAVLAAQSAAGLDTETLIRRLAKPAPATVAFTEIRFSPLLQAPLIVSGELEYSGPANFDRRVASPYQEATQIRGDSVRVEREGEPVRSFALKRAPELRGLLTGFTGLLTGDRAVLESEFEIAVSGNDNDWKMTLTPDDARTRKRLVRIEIDGSGSEPRCFWMLSANGGASIMLLGELAQEEIQPGVTPKELQRRCEEEGTGLGARGMGQSRKNERAHSARACGPCPRPQAPSPS